jgi:hypothetical protein
LGLLPEVNRREAEARRVGKSWLRLRGFFSIFEFAAKLAGVSEEQVRRVLNLERKFEDKPVLRKMLVTGEVSMNKLVKVASISTPENQEELAEKVKLLPARALETLARDEKRAVREASDCPGEGLMNFQNKIGDGLREPSERCESVHVNTQLSSIDAAVKLMGAMSDELKTMLLEMVEKGMDLNGILIDLLKRREAEIEVEKEELAQRAGAERESGVVRGAANNLKGDRPTPGRTFSRYISVRVKKVLALEHGKKCAAPACGRDAAVIHHTARFALAGAHDPRYLAPLCREHHLIAHSIDRRFWRERGRDGRT